MDDNTQTETQDIETSIESVAAPPADPTSRVSPADLTYARGKIAGFEAQDSLTEEEAAELALWRERLPDYEARVDSTLA